MTISNLTKLYEYPRGLFVSILFEHSNVMLQLLCHLKHELYISDLLLIQRQRHQLRLVCPDWLFGRRQPQTRALKTLEGYLEIADNANSPMP
jgi:hypothetical protein